VAAITSLNEPDLEDLLAKYELGGLERYWPASNGIENSNYFVRVANQRGPHEIVVTMLERPPNAGALLVPLLDVCADAGLPVAPIIRNRNGSASDHINGKATLVAPRLTGRHVVNPTVRQCESVGRFLARFHTTTAPLSNRAPDHPRNEAWLVQHSEQVRGFIPYADYRLLRDAVESIGSLLRREDVRRLPRGIVHGDVFRDNVLFSERALTGVVDFHHAAVGYWIYDLAVVANDWCNDVGGVLDLDRTLALLRAYNAIRPLTSGELWHFPMFALYAATSFWLSRLTVVLRRKSDAALRFNNPDEFRRIVERHAAHFCYFDPRLLRG
jgi:homoserine kinase type II